MYQKGYPIVHFTRREKKRNNNNIFASGRLPLSQWTIVNRTLNCKIYEINYVLMSKVVLQKRENFVWDACETISQPLFPLSHFKRPKMLLLLTSGLVIYGITVLTIWSLLRMDQIKSSCNITKLWNLKKIHTHTKRMPRQNGKKGQF